MEWYDHGNQITLNHNSLKLSFIHVRGIKLPPTLLLYVKQTWMTQLIKAISVSRYLSLIQKDSVTDMHHRAVYMQEGFPFAQDLSLENTLPFNSQPHKMVKHTQTICVMFSTGFTPSVF